MAKRAPVEAENQKGAEPAGIDGALIGPWHPSTDAERDAIRECLTRLIEHPLFANSKRYPALLRYTIERALKGSTEHLKERTIGADVFSRAPDYDTNTDPIVRMAMVEIRKRLQQYYQLSENESDIRIYFPTGSYAPEFRLPTRHVVDKVATSASELPVSVSIQKHRRWKWVAAGSALVVLAFLAVWFPASPSALEKFWYPVGKPPFVLMCVARGLPRPDGFLGPFFDRVPIEARMEMVRDWASYGNMEAVSLLSAFFGAKGIPIRLRQSDATDLEEFRNSPVILIGAFNNPWTLRLADQLRFTFVNDGQARFIQDRRNPQSRDWQLPDGLYKAGIQEDFAVITRVVDPTTGQLLVVAAGIQQQGSRAAAEFLTDPTLLEEAYRLAPGDWQHKNIQIVLGARIIGRNAGRPRVLAAYVW